MGPPFSESSNGASVGDTPCKIGRLNHRGVRLAIHCAIGRWRAPRQGCSSFSPDVEGRSPEDSGLRRVGVTQRPR